MYDAGSFGSGISDYVFELDDVRMAPEGLKNLDLSFHFAFLDWLECLDDYVLIVSGGDSSINFGIFSFSDFCDNFELIDVARL